MSGLCLTGLQKKPAEATVVMVMHFILKEKQMSHFACLKDPQSHAHEQTSAQSSGPPQSGVLFSLKKWLSLGLGQ